MTDMTVSQGKVQVAAVKQLAEARVKGAMDKAMATPKPEIFEPGGWGDIWAIGPIQPMLPGGPLQPSKIIKVGEPFYICTIMWLNPWLILPGGPSVCDLVTNLGCKWVCEYCTGNVCSWKPGPRELNYQCVSDLVPNQCYSICCEGWWAQPGWEGCYETHICCHITGCTPNAAPPLAGFATTVYDIDADLFSPKPKGPGYSDAPIRFMIY